MNEITVTIAEVVDWLEKVARKEIEFDWQRNRSAYIQYLIEVQYGLGGFTAESWFLDEGRKAFGWPQLIIQDYCQYRDRLQESAAPDPVLETLAALKAEVAALQAKLAAQDAPPLAPVLPTEEPAAESPAGEG